MKKLIEVALPLEAINKEATRENYIYKGNPSSIHKWWSGKPLSVSRAVLFAQLVDDPSEYMHDENAAIQERERLFDILQRLVIWENNNSQDVLDEARLEIARSIARNLNTDVPVGALAVREFLATKAPGILDPFAGGGSIPLEAQRLGLRAYASDLNPVAVLINKALIEIPPKFIDMSPIHPNDDLAREIAPRGTGKKGGQTELWVQEWKGVQGLAQDVRYYGNWMRNEAEKRIGYLYPKAIITEEILNQRPDLIAQGLRLGDELPVIAWIWARTAICPNPACKSEMPLVNKWWLSTNRNRPVWVEPIVHEEGHPKVNIRLHVGSGSPQAGTVTRNGAFCIVCKTPVSFEHIRNEGKNNRLGQLLLAIVAEAGKKRIYLDPALAIKHAKLGEHIDTPKVPETNLPDKALGFRVQSYGLTKHVDLFTPRQLVVLSTFLELIPEVINKICHDISKTNKSSSTNKEDYANAIATYLAFSIDKYLMYGCSLVPWYTQEDRPSMLFTRQAIPMSWDFVEINPFAAIGGAFQKSISIVADSLESIVGGVVGNVKIADAAHSDYPNNVIVSTDPPYYDNIGYSDLSDYFYVWLRLALFDIYPELFATLLVPKTAELVADQTRFGEKANDHFISGIKSAFSNIRNASSLHYPLTIYYAFKQAENETENAETTIASTGWEVMLDGLIDAGLLITGTWPIHTERVGRMRDAGSNALATSIVLVCRPRPADAVSATRREFLAALKRELPPALRQLQQGSIAPVDLAQAAIGPGMAVYSRYDSVLEADGTPMRVRAALALINQALDEYLSEQEGEYDADTRWALAWYEQFGHNDGAYGIAETLSTAKNTSVNGLVEAGILESRSGKVRLFRRDELDPDWNPTTDKRLNVWEATQHLIFTLDKGGEQAASELLSKLGSLSETIRDLGYRLYTVCERKGWAQDALSYNMLVVAWPRLKELASRQAPKQEKLI